MALVERYRRRHAGWNVKPFHAWYQRNGGKHSYTWVKNRLQEAGVVQKAPGRGKHRKRRTRAAWPGMMLHNVAIVRETRNRMDPISGFANNGDVPVKQIWFSLRTPIANSIRGRSGV